MRLLLFCILSIILISCKKNGSADPIAPTQNWKKITVNTGLVTDGIKDMIFDKDGNLWAAFERAIGKYDGQSWTMYKPFPPDPNGANFDNYAHAIMQDRNGNIWVTIVNKHDTYACKFDGSQWTTKLLTGVQIPAIIELQNGDIWFGSSGTGAYVFTGTDWLASNCDGSCYRIYSAFKDKNGVIWMGGSRNSLIKYAGGSYTRLDVPFSDLYGGDIVQISQATGTGEIYASMTPGGAWKLTNNGWQRILEPNLVPGTGAVYSILEDTKGRVWIGTESKGVYELNGQKLIEHGLDGEKAYVNKIIEGKNGVIWLGNAYGLFKYE